MAHESFEDKEIAHILNTCFIPVKVDREERPEIDLVYMSVCQAMTGQGGWPLTIIMGPDKQPFFAGTYLPPRPRHGMAGLLELLSRVALLWEQDRQRLLQMSQEIISLMRQQDRPASPGQVSWEPAQQGYKELKAVFDRDYGGFGQAPKFPAPHNLLFLMMFYAARDDQQALSMARTTLTSMARGGIHDQIGGGFSRYSTDRFWLVPHFEKMLYDNALLALAYLEGFRLTGNAYYKRITEKILTYVSRELTDREGGFYCGQDADSEGVEGKYYIFTEHEIRNVLKHPRESQAFCQWFGVRGSGNFEGKHILNLLHNQDYEDTSPFMEELCNKVYEYRSGRTHLHRDDKILTSWTSMMMIAYAKAGFLLGNEAYVEQAQKAQAFVEAHLVDANDRILVRYRDGEGAFPGNLDDYAYYCLGLLTLYEVTLDINYLEMAVHRAGQMTGLFWDNGQGGFYFYGRDAQELIQRPKELYDGAIPSGNSAAAHVLLALASLTAQPSWRELADRQLGFLAAGIKGHPSAHSFSLMAFIKALGTARELICISAENKVPQELFDSMKEQGKLPLTVLFKCPENEERLSLIAPFTKDYRIPVKGSLYYLCEDHTCGAPSASPGL